MFGRRFRPGRCRPPELLGGVVFSTSDRALGGGVPGKPEHLGWMCTSRCSESERGRVAGFVRCQSGCILAQFGLTRAPVGFMWAPCGSIWPEFAAIRASFGSTWAPCVPLPTYPPSLHVSVCQRSSEDSDGVNVTHWGFLATSFDHRAGGSPRPSIMYCGAPRWVRLRGVEGGLSEADSQP